MKSPPDIGRRRLLQLGLAGCAAQLAGCSTIDRFFGADGGIYDDEVVIIGGGIAGLSAAYELKRRQIPYRVFEASGRLGGRVRTVESLGGETQFAELGAELIDPRHQGVFDLAQELQLRMQPLPAKGKVESQLVILDGKILSTRELMKDLQPANSRLMSRRLALTGDEEGDLHTAFTGPKARELDRLSAADLIDEVCRGLPSRVPFYLRRQCLVQFGVEADRQSSLHLVMSLDPENPSPTAYRIEGGTSGLTRALYDRVRGVLPDFFVRLNSRLTEIEKIADRFILNLQTPQGNRRMTARSVILALPPTAMRSVKGLEALSLSDTAREAITGWKLSSVSRTVVGFREKPWLGRQDSVPASQGSVMGDFELQSFWDSSRAQTGEGGLLSFSTGGDEGALIGASAPDRAVAEAARLWRRAKSLHDDRAVVQNWSRQTGIGGAHSVFAPGKFTRWNGVWSREEIEPGLFIAGEHASFRFHGTVQGAIETGRWAGSRAARFLSSS